MNRFWVIGDLKKGLFFEKSQKAIFAHFLPKNFFTWPPFLNRR